MYLWAVWLAGAKVQRRLARRAGGRRRMGQDTLQEVLEVERRIRELLDAETHKAQQWLEQALRESEQAAQATRAQLQASLAQREAAARRAADAEADALVRRARVIAERIAALDEEILLPIVWRHMAVIGPEGHG